MDRIFESIYELFLFCPIIFAIYLIIKSIFMRISTHFFAGVVGISSFFIYKYVFSSTISTLIISYAPLTRISLSFIITNVIYTLFIIACMYLCSTNHSKKILSLQLMILILVSPFILNLTQDYLIQFLNSLC